MRLRVHIRRWFFLYMVACAWLHVASPAHAMILPKVLVSTEVLQPLVDDVLKGITSSSVLFAPAQDLHHANIRPSQVALLDEADIFIVPDRALSPTLKKWYDKIEARGGIVLSLTDAEEAQALPLVGAADDDDNAKDPHIWLDPLRMANLAPVIARSIASYTPEIDDAVHANAQRAARHIRATLMPNIARYIKSERGRVAPRNVFTLHAAYRYFTERFDLHHVHYHRSAHAHRGAKTQLAMMDEITALKPRCIIGDSPSRRVTKLAEKLYIPLKTMEPTRLYSSKEVTPMRWFRNDYDRLIFAVAKQFVDCF